MWYPKVDILENVLKECCEKFKCSEEDLVKDMVFEYRKKEIKNYKDYLSYEAETEYFFGDKMPNGRHKIMIYCWLKKRKLKGGE